MFRPAVLEEAETAAQGSGRPGMEHMKDKAIIVTGAFGALGRAVVQAAAADGARIAAIDQGRAVETAALYAQGGVDLSEPAAAAAAIEAACEGLGRIDALVNVAGAFRWETVADGAPDTWDFLLRANLHSAVNASRAALPALLASGSGAIVNIGAGAALRSGAGMGAYAASKAGVHRFTESLAEELKGKVRVNAVLPSVIDTPANRRDMPDADFSIWVNTDELARVILFLASPAASGVTGALIPVNGRV